MLQGSLRFNELGIILLIILIHFCWEEGLIRRKYSFYCTSCGDLDPLGEVSSLRKIDLSFRKNLFSRIATFMGICFDIKVILCMHYDFRFDVLSLEI